MADETVTPIVAEKKPARARAAFDTQAVKQLALAAVVAHTAQRPECAAPLAEREITAAFVSQLLTDEAACQGKIAQASTLRATGKNTTATERTAKQTLLERTTDIQSAVMLQWSGQPAHKGDREAYGIGKPLRSLSRPNLETVLIGISQRLTTDTLPGITTAKVQAFQSALTAWQSTDISQSTHATDAAQLLIEAKADLASINARRLKLQLAADAAFPYYEKENAALRSEFGLPKTRPFRPVQE
ncbi:hypothetical protein [Armatimonas sp.]|uniref:hypothetical protein n=1 Tax=Armatimonas sp. TaxID=1872638 RepID=UPI003751B895